MQDSFYRGLTPEESKRVHEYNFDHPGNLVHDLKIYLQYGHLNCSDLNLVRCYWICVENIQFNAYNISLQMLLTQSSSLSVLKR